MHDTKIDLGCAESDMVALPGRSKYHKQRNYIIYG